MIRTIVWTISFWLSLLLLLPFLLYAKLLKDEQKKVVLADQMARKWSRFLLALAGANVEVRGLERIPTEGPVVYVANHQSNFDIPLMIAHMPKTKGFIAKKELLKMPVVKSWMRYMKCVFIDREDIRQQVKSISEGVAQIKLGQSMVIFPEGTRSADGSLGTFKAGSLKLATKSNATIVPVAICNSRGLMPKGLYKVTPANVVLKICQPIENPEQMNRETNELAERIKHEIDSYLKNDERMM